MPKTSLVAELYMNPIVLIFWPLLTGCWSYTTDTSTTWNLNWLEKTTQNKMLWMQNKKSSKMRMRSWSRLIITFKLALMFCCFLHLLSLTGPTHEANHVITQSINSPFCLDDCLYLCLTFLFKGVFFISWSSSPTLSAVCSFTLCMAHIQILSTLQLNLL